MPRVQVPIRTLNTDGVQVNVGAVAADSANGHYIPGAGDDLLLVMQNAGTTAAFTFKLSPPTDPAAGVPTDRQMTPTINVYNVAGPFPAGDYEQPQAPGGVWVDLGGGATINLFAFRVPRSRN
jgi:hypothetical protein